MLPSLAATTADVLVMGANDEDDGSPRDWALAKTELDEYQRMLSADFLTLREEVISARLAEEQVVGRLTAALKRSEADNEASRAATASLREARDRIAAELASALARQKAELKERLEEGARRKVAAPCARAPRALRVRVTGLAER